MNSYHSTQTPCWSTTIYHEKDAHTVYWETLNGTVLEVTAQGIVAVAAAPSHTKARSSNELAKLVKKKILGESEKQGTELGRIWRKFIQLLNGYKKGGF